MNSKMKCLELIDESYLQVSPFWGFYKGPYLSVLGKPEIIGNLYCFTLYFRYAFLFSRIHQASWFVVGNYKFMGFHFQISILSCQKVLVKTPHWDVLLSCFTQCLILSVLYPQNKIRERYINSDVDSRRWHRFLDGVILSSIAHFHGFMLSVQ